MHHNDIDACLHISEEVFGANYHHPFYFDLKNKNYHYFIAKKNNRIIGFSILYEISKQQMKIITTHHFQLTYDYYSLIDVIAINKKEQKKGAGTALLKKILSVTKPEYPLYSIAWKDSYGINIEKLYKNLNITPRVNLGKIWAHGCNHKFQCSSYNKQCQCEGLLFKLN